MVTEAQRKQLLAAAQGAREKAYAPYSDYKVGAALLTADGHIYSGANVENASYGLTVCAERVALLKALSEGVKRFRALAVVTAAKELTPPCGACRQLLWEYCGDIPVYLSNLRGKVSRHTLAELFPRPFDERFL